MKPRRSFQSFLGSVLEYNELPKILDPDCRNQLYEKLRGGDKEVAEPLIKGHMRLAMALVSENYNSQWNDDLVGVAMFELVKRIDYLRRGKNDTISDETLTPYLASAIRRRVKDFLWTFPYMGAIARSTLRKYKKEGKQVGFSIVHGAIRECEFADIIAWPAAKKEEVDLELQEILTLAIRTPNERRVINLRAQGYTRTDIAPILGKSIKWVCIQNSAVEERFDTLMLA